MMEVIKSTNVARFSLLSFFFILFTQSKFLLAQQEEFVSIQCCAPSNFTDPNTKILWSSDTNVQNNGKCEFISNFEENDYIAARFFHGESSDKWCYKLKTVNGQNYLVRGTFLRGDQTPENTSFDVSLGATPVGRVSASVKLLELEAIFVATNDNIDFCIMRISGNPYLFKLELRPLGDSDYSERDPSSILKVVIRSDVGNTRGVIRYPYDLVDRIWNKNVSQIVNATQQPNPNMGVIGANTTIPIPVLQTAVTNADHLDFFHDGLSVNDADYLIYLYFLELNATVLRGQRAFDIYVNGKVQPGIFDMLGHGNTSNYNEVVVKVRTNRFLNVSLIKVDGAEYGPMLNAYEIFEVQKWVEGTLQTNVDIIVKLRDELLLENQNNEVLAGWSGDPCLPLAWHGLRCHASENGSMVITHLDLSSNDLKGPLPPVIVELPHLWELNLSFNQFQGTIPHFPLYSVLMSIDVRHNELNGPIPESLASLPQLSKLYFGCNPHFGKVHQSKLLDRSNLTTDSGVCTTTPHPRSGRYVVMGCVAAGSLLFTVAVGAMFICIYRRRLLRKLDDEDVRATQSAVFSIASIDDFGFQSISVRPFTLECIENATQKYNTLIGEGGFGSVYRGTLPDGQDVAVKVRSATSTQGTREFENELNLLSAMWHENLVPLIGYCCDFDQQILVYPFMSNGSLQDRLYGEASKRKVLDWTTRLSIALGAARGLLYLHTFAGRCIIHRDVKSSNILLDHRMTARVADFGFSKYAPQEGDSNASLEVRGTAGYLDPEYYSTQHLSAKSDVFSFGVVLLEIISGREPLDIHRPRNEWSLVEWAKPLVRDSRIEEMIDPNIKAGHAETMWRVVEVALMCIEPFSAYRPCMADIVRELEDALIIENNASEYMKSYDSIGGSNRYSSIDKKLGGSSKRYSSIEKKLAMAPTPTEPSPIISQALAPPQPR